MSKHGSGTLPPDTTTIAEARAWLKLQIHQGEQCPCCRQMVRAYHRAINKPMARWLIWLVQTYERELARYHLEPGDKSIWIDIRTAPVRGGDYGKLTYWKLCERKPGKRPKAVRGSGLWRPTQLGIDLAYDRTTVPSHAIVYRAKLLGWSQTRISIREALGGGAEYDLLVQSPPGQRLDGTEAVRP